MTLDVAFCLAYLALATALAAAMAVKGVYRSSPLFFAYVFFELVASAAALSVYRHTGFSAGYRLFYLAIGTVDLALYFGLLTEVGRNLLRFSRERQPRWNVAAWLFVCAGQLIFTLSPWTRVPELSWISNVYFLSMRVDEDLQFAGFLALISWSSLCRLRWPERELHIASGLGLMTFVMFLVALLHCHWRTGPVYHALDLAVEAANVAAAGYWLRYFWIVADRERPGRHRRAAGNGPRGGDAPSRVEHRACV